VVASDVETVCEARRWVDELDGRIGFGQFSDESQELIEEEVGMAGTAVEEVVHGDFRATCAKGELKGPCTDVT